MVGFWQQKTAYVVCATKAVGVMGFVIGLWLTVHFPFAVSLFWVW